MKNKKILYYFGLSLLFVLNIILSSCLVVVGANLPSNTANSISEIIYQEKIDEKIGIVYSHKVFSESWEFCPLNPEYSKELRSIGMIENPIDVYLSNFFESTPAVVNYLEKSEVPISFLLLPKIYISDNAFLYDFELFCGDTNSCSNPEDIYINSQHADFLLESLNLSRYEDLLGYQIEYDYFSKHCNKGSSVSYKIRGIINEKCELYKFYQKYIGDFFIGNQYLSLPINSATIFDISKSRDEMTMQLENIDKIYNYESVLQHFGSEYILYSFEYRYMAIGQKNSSYSYESIQIDSNSYFDKIQSCYDYYFYKQNVSSMIVYCLFAVIVFYALFFSLHKVLKIQDLIICSKKKKYLKYAFIGGAFLSSYLGILVSKLMNIIFKYNFSVNFWGSLIILISYMIFLTFYIFIKFMKANKE